VVDWAGVAAHADDELADVDDDDAEDDARVEAVCVPPMAMPDPNPRNAATLIAPAISRDRAAAWCRFFRPLAGTGRARGCLRDRSVVSIMSLRGLVDASARSLGSHAWVRLQANWESAVRRSPEARLSANS
jgi:hypothetical protein